MRWLAVMATAGLVAACGGGGGGGDSLYDDDDGNGGSNGPTATSMDVLASANTVGSSGSETVSITAIVKDSNNNGITSAPVTFSTDTGTLSGADATTDEAGVATATFSVGADKSNRPATVTVRSGSVAGVVTVAVVGTELAYSGATTFSLGATPTLTVVATDSSGTPLNGVAVTVDSSANNGLSSTSITTDSTGLASVQYTATNAGTDRVTFSGAGATTTARLTVSGEDFRFTSPASNGTTNVVVGASRTLTVTYRQNGAPQPGVRVSFASTIGTLGAASVVTDANGRASTTIRSDFAGSAVVTATLPGNAAQASVPLQFIATNPDRLILQISPTALAPNVSGSSTNQAAVTARVVDARDNPVTGVTVNFTQVQDTSGGRLSQPSAVTDNNGQASVKYISGATSTASAGVVIRASVPSDDTVDEQTATLTVSQSALFIALGTGNTIQNVNEETYRKDYTVYVTDANGVAVSGVTVTIKALPTRYRKGILAFNGTVWTYAPGVVTCSNEDADYDGVLDAGEDFNGSVTLEPGNVIAVSPGTVRTDEQGRATLSLTYAESYAPWVEIQLKAEAVVSGTASSKSTTFFVVGSSEDFSEAEVPPAGDISPFGTGACTSGN
jgi:hypothetical protein